MNDFQIEKHDNLSDVTFCGIITDDVAGELTEEHLVHVCPDLHVIAPACGAEVLHSGHLGGESDTSGAVNTPTNTG